MSLRPIKAGSPLHKKRFKQKSTSQPLFNKLYKAGKRTLKKDAQRRLGPLLTRTAKIDENKIPFAELDDTEIHVPKSDATTKVKSINQIIDSFEQSFARFLLESRGINLEKAGMSIEEISRALGIDPVELAAQHSPEGIRQGVLAEYVPPEVHKRMAQEEKQKQKLKELSEKQEKKDAKRKPKTKLDKLRQIMQGIAAEGDPNKLKTNQLDLLLEYTDRVMEDISPSWHDMMDLHHLAKTERKKLS